jgi:hypothetical protein
MTFIPTDSNKQKSKSLTDMKYMVIWLPPVGLFFLVCFCVIAYYAKKRCTKPNHTIRVQMPPQNRMSLEQNFTTV